MPISLISYFLIRYFVQYFLTSYYIDLIVKDQVQEKLNIGQPMIMKYPSRRIIKNLPRQEINLEMASQPMIFTGQILFEKYRVIKILNKGQLSQVYLVENIYLNNRWVMKVICFRENAGSFREEGLLKGLNHPNIPCVVDVFYKEEITYLIEEYFQGKTLQDYIEEKGSLDYKQVYLWAKELSELFEYLHNNKRMPLIYRDLKPSNVIITHHKHLVLVDFGISKHRKQKREKHFMAGTKAYASSEQMSLKKPLSSQEDFYSLSVLIIQLIIGKLPEDKKDYRDFCQKVPFSFTQVVLKSLILGEGEERYNQFYKKYSRRQSKR